MHGAGGALEFRRCDRQRLEEYAGCERFLTAYPQAQGAHWSALDDGPAGGDYGFVATLIRKLRREHEIPADQVYLVGVGPGGRLALRLAEGLGDEVRALAVVSMGQDPREDVGARADRFHQPVVFFRGSEDPCVPFVGGDVKIRGWAGTQTLGARAGLLEPASRDRCGTDPEVKSLPNPEKDGIHVRRVRYHGCEAGREVLLYEFFGAGHGWPGCSRDFPASVAGPVSREYHAAPMIWQFFRRHGLAPWRPPPTRWDGRWVDHCYDYDGGDPLWKRRARPPAAGFHHWDSRH